MIIKLDPSSIPYEPKMKGLCRVPYGQNGEGCPNFGKKDGCPPGPGLYDFFERDGDFYLIYTAFPIGEYAERNAKRGVGSELTRYPGKTTKRGREGIGVARTIEEAVRKAKPDWPEGYFPRKREGWEGYEREATRLIWWQPTARKAQREEEEILLSEKPELKIGWPEALGVNVTGLMLASAGIELDWRWPPPAHESVLTYRVSIAGVPKKQAP